MAYQQNGQRETETTKAVDAAMEASIAYYDALAGASAMHQNGAYAQVANTYARVVKAHRDFLSTINVKAIEDSETLKAEKKRDRRLQQYKDNALRKKLGLTKTAPLPRGGYGVRV